MTQWKKKETQFQILQEIRDVGKAQLVLLNQLLDNKNVPSSPIIVPQELRTIHIPQNLTIEAALAECKKLFPVWRWTDRDLDKIVTSDRTSDEAYSIKFKNCVEADNDLKEKSIKGITLLERIVMELDYFRETGNHLDIRSWTFCTGSRCSDGGVPRCDWYDGKFGVRWAFPGFRNQIGRSRAAIS